MAPEGVFLGDAVHRFRVRREMAQQAAVDGLAAEAAEVKAEVVHHQPEGGEPVVVAEEVRMAVVGPAGAGGSR
ncbi:hypothetical protein [Streptomyces sp. NPDC018045]|uniref:hypothetical protein n=1 Tax=Streptomyces sp. NPDC018045 TaxID=3365037 RepID=UPI0037A1E2E6